MKFGHALLLLTAIGPLVAGAPACAPAGATPDSLSAAGIAVFAHVDSLRLAGANAAALEVIGEHEHSISANGASAEERIGTSLRRGQAKDALGDRDGAIADLGRAVALARSANLPELEAKALISWAYTAKNLGRYDDSRHGYEAAANLARGRGSAGLRDLAAARAGLGFMLRRDPAVRDSAAFFIGEGVAILERIEEPKSLDLARARVTHALILVQLNRLAEARAAIEAARPVFATHFGADHAGMSLVSSIAGWLAYRTGDLDAAQRALEQTLAINARQRLEAKPGDRQRYRPKAADVLAGVHLAAGRPARAWEALDAAQSLFAGETITRRDAGPAPVDKPPHTMSEVQASLDPATAIVGWLDVAQIEEDPAASYIYVLRDRGTVRWFPLFPPTAPGETPPPSIAFNRLRAILATEAGWPTRLAPSAALDSAAHDAWRQRFAPAEPALKGVRNLVVVLSPWMAHVPIDLLIDDRGTPLLDRFAVSYIHSPSTLVDMTSRNPDAHGPRSSRALFIDGDLFSSEAEERGRIEAQAQFASRTRLPAGDGVEELLHRAWGVSSTRARPRLVQFDGHSALDPRLPGASALILDGQGSGMRALRPGALNGGEYSDDPADGLLTVSEIDRLHLPADLIVLAACQSAGHYNYGGFVGMGDAFLRAGASCVMTSLWPVDESSTVVLLRRFYAHAYAPDGTVRLPLAEALQRARQDVRSFERPNGDRPFAHPAYWAPFVLVGHPGAASGEALGARART